MKVQVTLGVLAALAVATTAANATPGDINIPSKQLDVSSAALDHAGKDLTVTDGKLQVAMPKITDGPIWAQFHQSSK